MVNIRFFDRVAVAYDKEISSHDLDTFQSLDQFVHFLLENFGGRTDAKRHAFVPIPAKRCVEGRQI